jgi:hypothetical protein
MNEYNNPSFATMFQRALLRIKFMVGSLSNSLK